MPPQAHAVLSASGAHRWLACPGSVALCKDIPRTTSVYAEEGTAAHAVGERHLREGTDAKLSVGKTVRKSAATGELIVCTEAMAEAVQVYLDFIRGAQKHLPQSRLLIEQKFKLDWLLPDTLWGTNDANLFQPYGKMVVVDYKHGQGTAVSAEENVQLMYYGLGALGHGNVHCIEQVEIVIVQPRAPGQAVKRWSTTPEALYQWGQDVLLPGAKRALSPGAPLKAGDHCKFCPALATCPKVREQSLAAAQVAFGDGVPDKANINLPAPSTMDTADLEKVHEVSGLIEKWASAVSAELTARLENGETGSRFKIVAGRATRKWTDDTLALEKLQTVIDPWTEPTLVSPAQAEKKLKAANVVPAEFLAGMVIESRGRSLAPIDDKRPALTGLVPFTPVFDAAAEELQ